MTRSAISNVQSITFLKSKIFLSLCTAEYRSWSMFYWKLISASSASKSDGNMAASNFVNVMPQVIGVSSNPSESTSLERKKSRKPRLRYADNAISQSGTAKEKLNFLFVLMPLLSPPPFKCWFLIKHSPFFCFFI